MVFIVCRDLLALNVYLAMCYHKLDYYDVSQVSDVTAAATIISSPTPLCRKYYRVMYNTMLIV